MLEALNLIANSMGREVVKSGGYYVIKNQHNQITYSQHRNLKCVADMLGSTLNCCTIKFAMEN